MPAGARQVSDLPQRQITGTVFERQIQVGDQESLRRNGKSKTCRAPNQVVSEGLATVIPKSSFWALEKRVVDLDAEGDI
jgi:hypothetical protein